MTMYLMLVALIMMIFELLMIMVLVLLGGCSCYSWYDYPGVTLGSSDFLPGFVTV